MAHRHAYARLDGDEDTDPDVDFDRFAEKNAQPRRPSSNLTRLFAFVTAALLVSIGANIILAMNLHTATDSRSPYTGLDRTRITRLEGYRRPEYTAANASAADAAWAAVNLGHGIVALDAGHARDVLGLPPSRAWKPDPAKAIYAVAAYHAMHCVPYLRSLIRDAHESTARLEDDKFHHALHCISILREEVMCTADDALLTMPMAEGGAHRLPVGHGQSRQCVDWAPLRDWATEHSAGYLTYEDHPGVPHWGVNYPPTDGWIVD